MRAAHRFSALCSASAGAALAILTLSGAAYAQTDVNPPLPNVLLLVDNSGSMELMMGVDPITGKQRLPTCNPTNPNLVNEQNRWTSLVTVMTGEIPSFTCDPEPRNTVAFKTEFGLGGLAPYDYNYYLPYNRPTSTDGAGLQCVTAPNTSAWPPATGGGVFEFPSNAITTHQMGNPAQGCTGFVQANDGLMDAFRDRVRFGMMTFDSSTDKGTGLLVPKGPNYATGFAGLWSYFPGWWTGAGTPADGNPDQCATKSILEVGARNAAAPPWEGKMIAFGDPAASQSVIYQQNDDIQAALLALRPYGATPTAGLLSDAQYFLTQDAMLDPVHNNAPFGPKDDAFILGGCRQTYIILLTDGAPNMDLRKSCEGGTGKCPYQKPEDIAFALANLPNNPIKTFVVGFALSTTVGPSPVDCTKLTQADLFDAAGQCAKKPGDDQLQACCTINRIAYNGGTSTAAFADDKVTLRKRISDILSNIAGQSTSRTLPVFSGASVSGAADAGFNFFSSFFVATGSLWSGVLERQRYRCEKDPGTGLLAAKPQAIVAGSGDEFATNPASGGGNINQNDAQHARYVYTVIGQSGSNGNINSTWTIRNVLPGATAETPPGPPTIGADGLGAYSGTTLQGVINASLVAGVPPQAMQVNVSGPQLSTCSSTTSILSPTACRDRVLRWELGLSSVDGAGYSREGNVFGSIYHSTPTVVGPPSEFLRDESYTVFQGLQATRPLVLYTATTDGQLHAFKVTGASKTDTFQVDTGAQNNELWSFIPPAVLPGFKTLYPGVQQNLLDGAPVVRDIVLSRSKTQVDLATSKWSTVLAAGFGKSFGGYYALDVTNPVRDPAIAVSGPKFLWQVSTDQNGASLFGGSSTPAITSVYVTPPGSSVPQELAVAILPGGDGPEVPCAGANGTSRLFYAQPPAKQIGINALGQPRNNVRCYAPGDPSRSLTIVRLDTGEVIRRFANPTALPVIPNTTTALFDSPMVGVPVAYPAGPGQISTRAFIGDKDGMVWRLDLTSSVPSDWQIVPFWDAFRKTNGWNDGQPIATPPAMSVDSVGNVVVIFSTGDQDQFSATPNLRNVAWSVRESPDPVSNTLQAIPDWHLGFGETLSALPAGISTSWNGGQRVAGPMAVFNGVVYFSTYTPPSGTSACDQGSSVLWGVDYLQSQAVGNGDLGPRGRLVIDPMTNPAAAPPAAAQANSLIFGVGISRTPPCYEAGQFSDPFLGFGSTVTTPSNLDSGGFQLVVQTGKNGGTAGGTQQTKTQTFNLPPPPTSVRISSWAAVVE